MIWLLLYLRLVTALGWGGGALVIGYEVWKMRRMGEVRA